jgi:outer membrane immunogenic protein
MRRLILSSLALAALAGGAVAADMPAPAPVRAPPPPVWSWSGCYMGLNAGYGWGRNNVADASETTAGGLIFTFTDFNFDSRGAFGGGQFGCNWQSSQAVFGFEADIQAAKVKGTILFPNAVFNFPSLLFSTSVTSELRYFGTVRGRIGYAFTPAAMLYVTGGFAYGGIDTTLSFPNAIPNFGEPGASAHHTHYGYAAGAGWEALLTPRMSVKAEYLYVDLGSGTRGFVITGDTYVWNERMKMHTVKLGLNFLWPWAVVANY